MATAFDPNSIPSLFRDLPENIFGRSFGGPMPGEDGFARWLKSQAPKTAESSTYADLVDSGNPAEVAASASLAKGIDTAVEEVTNKVVAIEKTPPAKTQALAVEFLKAHPEYLALSQAEWEKFAPVPYRALKITLGAENVDEADFWNIVDDLKADSIERGGSARIAPRGMLPTNIRPGTIWGGEETLPGEQYDLDELPDRLKLSPEDALGSLEVAAYATAEDVRKAFFAGDFVDEDTYKLGEYNRQNEAQAYLTLIDVMGKEGIEDATGSARDLVNEWMWEATFNPDSDSVYKYAYNFPDGDKVPQTDPRGTWAGVPPFPPGSPTVGDVLSDPRKAAYSITKNFVASLDEEGIGPGVDYQTSLETPYGAYLPARHMWDITAYQRMGPKALTPARSSQLAARYEPTLGAYILERFMSEEPSAETAPWYQYLDEGYTKSSKEFYDKDKMNQGWDLFVKLSKDLGLSLVDNKEARKNRAAGGEEEYALDLVHDKRAQRAAVKHRMGITGYGRGSRMREARFDRMYRAFTADEASRTPRERVGFAYWATENYPSLFAQPTTPATPLPKPEATPYEDLTKWEKKQSGWIDPLSM